MRTLTEKYFIKYDINITGDRVGHMEPAHKSPLYSLIMDVAVLKQGILNN